MPTLTDYMRVYLAPVTQSFDVDDPPPPDGLAGVGVDISNTSAEAFSCIIIEETGVEIKITVPPNNAYDCFFQLFVGIKDIVGDSYRINVKSKRR